MPPNRFVLLMALMALIVATGCASKVPFTHEMRSQYKLSAGTLKQIQFYVSGPITLQRVVDRGKAGVTEGHRLRIVDDKLIEEVVIQPNTPGIAVNVDRAYIHVSFEEGSSLMFVPQMAEAVANQNYLIRGKYYLGAAWGANNVGMLKYGGKQYRTALGDGWVHLVIDLDTLNRLETQSRIVKGRKLPGN